MAPHVFSKMAFYSVDFDNITHTGEVITDNLNQHKYLPTGGAPTFSSN